jgi:sulfoxide reductase heme-binding subunit YedZ
MFGFIPRDRGRQLTHILLALFTAAGCYLTFLLKPDASWVRILTISLGYTGLALIVVTLLIGPWNLTRIKQHRNPVNIYLRRDIGIWAGITGTLHVVFGLQVHRGGDIVLYFFEPTHDGLKVLMDVFRFSNYTGAAATVILALLLLLSNDLLVRWLRGPLWKWLQRSNYFLIALTLAHTLGYQIEVQRERIMIFVVVGLAAATLAVQFGGIALSISRHLAQSAAGGPTKTLSLRVGTISIAGALALVMCSLVLWTTPFILANRSLLPSPIQHEQPVSPNATPTVLHEPSPVRHGTPTPHGRQPGIRTTEVIP